MILVKIAPLKPIKEPTTVRVGLFKSMPSATKAHPEYEFSTVTQHGMSPPPTLPTRCTPMTDDSAVVPYMRLLPKPKESEEQNTPNIAACAPAMPRLSMFLLGKFIGADAILPFSFPNAIKLP